MPKPPAGLKTQVFKLLSQSPLGIRRLKNKEEIVQCLYLAARLRLFQSREPLRPTTIIAKLVPGANQRDCLSLLGLLVNNGFLGTYNPTFPTLYLPLRTNDTVEAIIKNFDQGK